MHEDFTETNLIWTWVQTLDGFELKQVRLDRAVGGDTDSVMMSMPECLTKGKSADEIVSIADGIGKDVNDSFHDWGMHAFNCPPERTKHLSADREVVADTAFFLAKKRYIFHVINDEGKDVDKLKIMGVELKRSSASEFLKEVLMAVVTAILDWKEEEDVNAILLKYKEEMRDRDITEIAVPSSCKTLNKATTQYEATGTMKGLHITAKSALLFNLSRGDSDPIINTGDKVYTVYTCTPEGSIAFPLDSPPPRWLLDIPINYERMWEAVHKAVHNYLTAMGWDFKSKKEEVRKSLFGDF